MAKKIAEVRLNSKTGLVQIKMNRGGNHTLKGEKAVRFEQHRNSYIANNIGESEANFLAATDYVEGRL